jgi:tRNA threonylcarbamoyladenosine biosynthesis protein TsaE
MSQNHILFETTYTKEHLYNTAKDIFDCISTGLDTRYPTVVLFYGDLGLGKTTFIKELGIILGVRGTITSPTFGIMRLYDVGHAIFKKFIHIDAYRLEEEKDVNLLNLKELFNVGASTLIVIEWPDKVKNALPQNTFSITLSNKDIDNEDERHVQLIKNF